MARAWLLLMLGASVVLLAVACGAEESESDALTATCRELDDSLDGDGDLFRDWTAAVAEQVNSSSVDQDQVVKNAGQLLALECGLSENQDYRPGEGAVRQLKSSDGRLFP